MAPGLPLRGCRVAWWGAVWHERLQTGAVGQVTGMWAWRVQGQAAETLGSQGPPDSASSCGCWGAAQGTGLEKGQKPTP